MGRQRKAAEPKSGSMDAGAVTTGDLLAAVQAQDMPTIERLLCAGADPNVSDEFGETALFEAASNNDAEVVAMLLLHSADPLKQSSHGQKARDLATEPAVQTLFLRFQGKAVDEEELKTALQMLSAPLQSRVKEHLASSAQAGAFSEMSSKRPARCQARRAWLQRRRRASPRQTLQSP